MNYINQAFILAAGRGERMKPLTDNIPKPLAKIKGRAMIDYILDKFDDLPEVNKIIINSYYLAEVLETHLRLLKNPRIIISHENEKLETGGGLVNALSLFDNNKPLLVINGDLFWKSDEQSSLLKKVIDNFNEEEMDILLALKPKDQFFGYDGNGDFNFNKQNGELSKAENPSHVYIGAQIIHPRIFKDSPKQKCFSLSYFFSKFIKEDGILQRVKGVEVDNQAFHIGTVKTLNEVNSIL